MKYFLCTVLLFLTLTVSAQKQAQKTENPCNSPDLVLYNELNQKISEEDLPLTKVKLVVTNNPRCSKSITFKVLKAKAYYVRGVRPLAQADIEGEYFDFSVWKGPHKPGDRILIEVLDISYTMADGLKGQFPGSVIKNWHYKE